MFRVEGFDLNEAVLIQSGSEFGFCELFEGSGFQIESTSQVARGSILTPKGWAGSKALQ